MKCPHCGQEIEIEPVIIASGEDFERYLCDQINTLKSARCETTKASGDQGVDLVVTLKSGQKIAVQCKLYSTPVGNDAVQEVIAGRLFYKCDSAIVVSNNTYTPSAEQLAKAADVTLLNYKDFKNYIDKISGGFDNLVIDEMREYLSCGNNEAMVGDELRFLVDMALGGSACLDKLDYGWEVLARNYSLNHANISPLMNFVLRHIILIEFRGMGVLANDGVFGDGLIGIVSERRNSHTVLPLTDEREKSVENYIATWESMLQRFKLLLDLKDVSPDEVHPSKLVVEELPQNLKESLMAMRVMSDKDVFEGVKQSCGTSRWFLKHMFGSQVPWASEVISL
jgi:hypothetical protein